MCHVVYTRPQFEPEDWEQYRRVNRKFADAVLEEVGDGPAVVFVQDYHFALLPRMLKNARPDLVVAQFWHIPWPNREVFRVCPWQDEILDGMLGNDLLAFHIQYHCNNFLDTIDRTLEAKVDMEHFAVTRGGHTTMVRPFPISIDSEADRRESAHRIWRRVDCRLRRAWGIKDERILVGVDRVDYTKGIPERFAAVDRLLKRIPSGRRRSVSCKSAPRAERTFPAYRQLNDDLHAQVEEINWRHGPEFLAADHFPQRTSRPRANIKRSIASRRSAW